MATSFDILMLFFVMSAVVCGCTFSIVSAINRQSDLMMIDDDDEDEE